MEDFSCPPGKAFIGMKTWASSIDESADMVQAIGKQIGFTVTGRIEVYETEPTQPPRDNPYGYDINFTPYDLDDATSSRHALEPRPVIHMTIFNYPSRPGDASH